MKKKDNVISENYLEKIPMRPEESGWSTEEMGIVTLDLENPGVKNRIAQKLIHKPKVTHVHLDATGSFVWPLLVGKNNIIDIGELVPEQFGEEAVTLYPRLAKFFQILDSYHFLKWQ